MVHKSAQSVIASGLRPNTMTNFSNLDGVCLSSHRSWFCITVDYSLGSERVGQQCIERPTSVRRSIKKRRELPNAVRTVGSRIAASCVTATTHFRKNPDDAAQSTVRYGTYRYRYRYYITRSRSPLQNKLKERWLRHIEGTSLHP